ncbi:MAG: hypothetical protein RRY07_03570, partial [Bacteroidaceae bacterium]
RSPCKYQYYPLYGHRALDSLQYRSVEADKRGEEVTFRLFVFHPNNPPHPLFEEGEADCLDERGFYILVNLLLPL